MGRKPRINGRLIIVALLAVGLLVALVLATGGGFPNPNTVLTSTPAPEAASSPTPSPTQHIAGKVTVVVRHRAGNTWQFLYTVRNTGSTPIAGFELSAPRSNLSAVTVPTGWAVYGSGVCGGRHGGILAYWSTATASPTAIGPGAKMTFGFTVRTKALGSVLYSLSSGAATPLFGNIQGPAPSTLPARGSCTS
ncbi:MAG TPA: hypothetical protein VF898_10550 [Chloroflexota bacterium]